VGIANEEERVQQILQKIALLCKTRGIVFLSCYQDCDRSESISLITPRHSGKATPAQFRQHFPFIGDLDESEIRLLAKRYTTASNDINYQALDRDITEADEKVPPPSGDHAPSNRVPQSPQSPVAGKKISAERYRQEALLQETRQSVDVMDKLRAIMCERRLRLHNHFIDFDKLRKGVCRMSQVRTIFTVLGIELEGREYKSLEELFCNEEGLFRYREFCSATNEFNQLETYSWDMEPPPTPSTAREERPGSRIRYKAPLSTLQQLRLPELESRIRSRAVDWSLDLKRSFQDFPHAKRTGHITRTQFLRMMNMLGYELTKADADMLCQAYCDTDNGQEFNLIDFCASVMGRGERFEPSKVFQVSRRPKYFDRSGETISPCQSFYSARANMQPFQRSPELEPTQRDGMQTNDRSGANLYNVIADGTGRNEDANAMTARISKTEPSNEDANAMIAMGREVKERFRNMRTAFRKMDQNHDGRISKKELLEMCRQWNIPQSEALIRAADVDNTGTLDFAEFAQKIAATSV